MKLLRFWLFFAAIFSLLLIGACDEDNPPAPVPPFQDLDVDACMTTVAPDTFEIMTWNVEQFPLDVQITISQLKKIIEKQDPDIIAMQEITSEIWLKRLTDSLSGWDYQIFPDDYLSLAYLYKTSEVNVINDVEPVFTDNFFAFPRPALHFVVSHTNGQAIHFFNLHLKCCDGAENFERRDSASSMLKRYIDTNLNDQPVIILGDFNDEISSQSALQNPFLNFIDDSLNYKFTDMDIAKGDSRYWSYPSYPSHIDHIMISNELFSSWHSVATITYDDCDKRYLNYISDHRPLMLKVVY